MWRSSSILAVLMLGVTASAQSVAPLIVEYKARARGSFQVTNSSIYPLDVVLEPFGFTVDSNGKASYRPLDSDIHLRLSSKSFRVAPRQNYAVFYEASADSLPAWFTIYATLSAATTTRTGLKIVLKLPHTVYLLTQQPLARNSVVFLRAETARGKRAVDVELENHGAQFSRVQEVVVSAAGRKKKNYAGFPFFPGQHRLLHLEWDQPSEPERITLKFAKFKLEHPISVAAGSP